MLQQKYQIHHTTIQVEDFVEQDMSSCSRYLSCRVTDKQFSTRVIIELIRSTSSCVQRSSSFLKLIGPPIILCIQNQFVSRVIRLSGKGIGSKQFSACPGFDSPGFPSLAMSFADASGPRSDDHVKKKLIFSSNFAMHSYFPSLTDIHEVITSQWPTQ